MLVLGGFDYDDDNVYDDDNEDNYDDDNDANAGEGVRRLKGRSGRP
jgi:hypothetical protein